jgi:anti-sigma regulatory factor (Ser/Thr protein kinase)
MGELRQAMRTAAVSERSPAAVLEHINSVINLRKTIGMVTAIFGFYEPHVRELVYAVAGHPPPIITIADGFSGFLPGGGMPLGVEAQIHASDWTLTLPPRSGVVFYTDGMTEYSRDVIAGERHLLEASVRGFEVDPENPAIALQERIFDATVNRDDAAVLTLSCYDGVLPQELHFSAVPLVAPIVRSFLHRFCDEYALTSAQRFSLITAVGEAVANAVEHAYRGEPAGDLVMRTEVDNDTVNIEIEDHGRWRPFMRRDERGRGIVLMHELMDHVRITSAQNKTVIRLIMNRIDAESAQH